MCKLLQSLYDISSRPFIQPISDVQVHLVCTAQYAEMVITEKLRITTIKSHFPVPMSRTAFRILLAASDTTATG